MGNRQSTKKISESVQNFLEMSFHTPSNVVSSKIRSDIFPTPKTNKTTNKTAVIILFISNESILIIIILDV